MIGRVIKTSSVVIANVGRRIDAATLLLRHAKKAKVSNIDKSIYYRASIVLLCTVVEGMVYEIVKKNTIPPDHIIKTTSRHNERHQIPASIFGTPDIVYFCDKVSVSIGIDDDGVDFGKFNVYLKNKKIVNEREYKELDWVRTERNKIHLQGLKSADIGYTRTKINRIGRTLDFLVSKV